MAKGRNAARMIKMSVYKRAFISTAPVFAGYLVLGMGCGIVLSSKGYDVIWAIFMSIFMYAGSGQYLAAELLASSASLITTAIATLLVQARHLFYGISLLERYKGAGFKKFYMIHALTDETYSLVTTTPLPEGVDRHKYYFLVSIFDHIYWILGNTIGALVGTYIDFNTKGVDFALTALFVSIFTDQWMTKQDRLSAIIGIVSTALCLLIFGSQNFLIPTMILITVVLISTKRFRKEGENV